MTHIRIGLNLPSAQPGPDGLSISAAARLADDLGLESAWAPDVIIGDGSPAVDPWLALTAAATATRRIRVGTGVLAAPLRPTGWLAVQTATLQQLSGDRLLLGVGSGGFPGSPFWRSVGAPTRGRGRVTDAVLDALPRLLAGEPVAVGAEELPMQLAPATAPPVLIGGSEVVFDRVLRHRAEWFPSLIGPHALAASVARLHQRAAERGAPDPGITVGGHLVIGEDDTARRTREALVDELVTTHGMSPQAAAEAPVSARTPEELAETFTAYAEAGAGRVVLSPDTGDWRDQARFVAEAGNLLR